MLNKILLFLVLAMPLNAETTPEDLKLLAKATELNAKVFQTKDSTGFIYLEFADHLWLISPLHHSSKCPCGNPVDMLD